MTEVVSEEELAAVADPVELDDTEAPEGTPQSPLDILKGRRAQLQAKLHIDLAVPRWDDIIGCSIWIRYGPADLSLWSNAQQKRETAHIALKKKNGVGDPKWAVKANADVLVDACRGVYFLEPGEKPPEGDVPDDLPTFSDPELATALDIQPGNAVRTVLGLYGTDGDLLMAANALLGFSGEASKEADSDFLKD